MYMFNYFLCSSICRLFVIDSLSAWYERGKGGWSDTSPPTPRVDNLPAQQCSSFDNTWWQHSHWAALYSASTPSVSSQHTQSHNRIQYAALNPSHVRLSQANKIDATDKWNNSQSTTRKACWCPLENINGITKVTIGKKIGHNLIPCNKIWSQIRLTKWLHKNFLCWRVLHFTIPIQLLVGVLFSWKTKRCFLIWLPSSSASAGSCPVKL